MSREVPSDRQRAIWRARYHRYRARQLGLYGVVRELATKAWR